MGRRALAITIVFVFSTVSLWAQTGSDDASLARLLNAVHDAGATLTPSGVEKILTDANASFEPTRADGANFGSLGMIAHLLGTAFFANAGSVGPGATPPPSPSLLRIEQLMEYVQTPAAPPTGVQAPAPPASPVPAPAQPPPPPTSPAPAAAPVATSQAPPPDGLDTPPLLGASEPEEEIVAEGPPAPDQSEPDQMSEAGGEAQSDLQADEQNPEPDQMKETADQEQSDIDSEDQAENEQTDMDSEDQAENEQSDMDSEDQAENEQSDIDSEDQPENEQTDMDSEDQAENEQSDMDSGDQEDDDPQPEEENTSRSRSSRSAPSQEKRTTISGPLKVVSNEGEKTAAIVDSNGTTLFEGSLSQRNGVSLFSGKNKTGQSIVLTENGTGMIHSAGVCTFFDSAGSFTFGRATSGDLIIRDNRNRIYTGKKNAAGQMVIRDPNSNSATVLENSKFRILDPSGRTILEGDMNKIYELAAAHYQARFPKPRTPVE